MSQNNNLNESHRPLLYDQFIGQKPTIQKIKTAICGVKKESRPLGHVLLTGPSGHGKTTLARIIANDMEVRVHHVTAYALTKPAEMISLLNSLQPRDVLFIDEIHRIKPIIEEVLYVAMEDFALDMLLPDGKPLRLSLYPFTLIGATTKPESLSTPLKNRFVYKLHFEEYNEEEKIELLLYHLSRYGIQVSSPKLLYEIGSHLPTTPREIANICTQLYDRLRASFDIEDHMVNEAKRQLFWQNAQLYKGGLTHLHHTYIDVLRQADGRPVSLKTLAVSIGIHEKTIEEEIEPILLKQRIVEKTTKGRILLASSKN